MYCPECNSKSTVVITVRETDAVHRKRRCDVCGHVFFTEEYEAISSDRYYELMREFERKRRENGKGRKN